MPRFPLVGVSSMPRFPLVGVFHSSVFSTRRCFRLVGVFHSSVFSTRRCLFGTKERGPTLQCWIHSGQKNEELLSNAGFLSGQKNEDLLTNAGFSGQRTRTYSPMLGPSRAGRADRGIPASFSWRQRDPRPANKTVPGDGTVLCRARAGPWTVPTRLRH